MNTRYTYLKAAMIAVSVIILIVTTIMVGQRTLAKNDGNNSNMGLIWFTSDRDNPSTAGMCGNCESIYVTSADGSDPERLTKNGADEGARWNDNAPAWSLIAKRIAFQTNRNGHPQIFLMRADGTEQTLLADLGATPEGVQIGAQFPSWSPNGEQLCFSSVRQPRDIYVINADGSGLTNVSNDPADDLRCDWSPAGDKIAFASNRDSIDGIRNDEVYVMNSDGSQPVRLTFAARSDISPDWSPNGERIAFESNRDLNAEIYVMNADGTDQIRLTNSPFQDSKPTWSPDGNKIAFHHRGANFPSGHLEVYTMDQDGTNIFQITFTASPGFSGFPNWGRRSQGQ